MTQLHTARMGAAARVIAVLGPTNTGKTHFAIERMLAHRTGMIGLPLRLLAREVYDRVVAAKGADAAALVTGEEKIVGRAAQYWICTVESMPLGIEPEFVAIDEIQMVADPERGHVFTDRLLHARGASETLFLGAETMRGTITRLVPETQFVTRPRFSDLAYTGAKKLTRLPRRSAIVAFSANEVYAIAELIRRQRGGAAVVMGALSPRTRNAQVALYQSGDVDFLVATDAIGMGLNMDVDHVAFASLEKFDGGATRPLRAQELAQIAGRAGRHMNDGTFGVTGELDGIDAALVTQIEEHRFDPVRVAQWRNSALDFGSIDRLLESLDALPPAKGLMRTRPASDMVTLRTLKEADGIAALAGSAESVRLLWEVCQLPDFRKVTADEHARLAQKIFEQLAGGKGVIDADWLGPQIAGLDNAEGEIDAIQTRLAHIRTWTYAANRPGWLADAGHWQERTRAVEDRLSDALHEKLTQRFIDRRTSALMKKLRDDEAFEAVIQEDGEVLVESEYVGRMEGLRFAADPRAEGLHGKALKAAALRGLSGEIANRAFRLANAEDKDLTLTEHGRIWWEGAPVAMLARGPSALKPRLVLIADEQITPTAWARAETRLNEWVESRIAHTLKPLFEVDAAMKAEGEGKLVPQAAGLAFRLGEGLGAIDRETIRDEMNALPQEARGQLRKLGVRFARHSVFLPALLKPEPGRLKALLAAIHMGLDRIPPLPPASQTSFAKDEDASPVLLAAAGYRVLGPRAVRLDMLERLAELIEAKRGPDKKLPPFAISPDMLSLLGCSAEEMAGVLKAMGFRAEGAVGESGQTILLWRPKRRHDDGEPRGDQRGERREGQGPRGPRRPFKPREGETQTAAAPGDAPSPEERKRERPRRNRGKGPRREGGEAPVIGAAPEAKRDDRPRPDKPRFDKPREERKFDRPRREDGPRRDEPRVFESRAPKKGQSADPDSPFAVLAKLKG
jgi:ATP-dependent RNA helicase SUPV3L1/SUV3